MTGYTEADLRRAVTAAVRAPSLHNSQPWRFRLRDGCVEVLLDRGRLVPVADPAGWGARIACGAATFNARLALATAGRPAQVRFRPEPDDPDLLARLRPGPARPPTYAEERLFTAVPLRRSNRQPFWPTPVESGIRAELREAARDEGAWMELLIGMTALSAVTEIVQAADRVLRRDGRYQAELAEWARTDDAPDGVPVGAAAPVGEPHDLLPQRGYGTRTRPAGRDYEPEPLVAVLGSAGDGPVDQLAAGQAMQRVLLTATAAGLAASLISQPIEVPAAREQLRLALGRTGTPQMVLRLGYGGQGRVTPRRPIDEVVTT
jgi:nitroreductase